MSWTHQRTRDLADQILDDAHSFRQRVANAVDAARRGGLVVVDTLLDVPAACRAGGAKVAFVAARAATNTAAAALDAGWVLVEAGRWACARPSRLLAVATAPLVPAVAVLVAFSSQTAEGPARASVLSVRQDASLSAAVHPLHEALATRRRPVVVAPAPKAAAGVPARVKPVAAPRRASAPAPVAVSKPKPIRAVTAPQRRPAPTLAPAAPARATPAAAKAKPKPRPAPVAAPAAKPRTEIKPGPAPAATPPPVAEQPKPPAAAAVPVAVGEEEDDDDRGEGRKERKGKRGGDDNRDRDDHEEEDDDDHGDGRGGGDHGEEDDD